MLYLLQMCVVCHSDLVTPCLFSGVQGLEGHLVLALLHVLNEGHGWVLTRRAGSAIGCHHTRRHHTTANTRGQAEGAFLPPPCPI